MTTTHDQLLDRFFAAIEAGDVDTIGSSYADDVQVWNNVAQVPLTKAENLKLLGYVTRHLAGMRYEILERIEHPGGVTQRHVLHGQVGDQSIASEVCIVFRISGDKITHIFEYLDSASVSALFARS
jgi:ketosteroid isomerase-like protein